LDNQLRLGILRR